MRVLAVAALLGALAPGLAAQVTGKWPPDSLVNTKVFPKDTPVSRVVGAMRNMTSSLGVRCPFCHVGEEGKGLETFDFPSDKKRTKLVARQMMRMVEEINHRLDTLPERQADGPKVACATCHRGVSRPVPLSDLLTDAVTAAGSDSAVRAYHALRERYYGRDSYDFGEGSLNMAAFQSARASHYQDALALLALNEEYFPGSPGIEVARGNIQLMNGDTTAAIAAFREAIQRDSTNREARGRLRELGQRP